MSHKDTLHIKLLILSKKNIYHDKYLIYCIDLFIKNTSKIDNNISGQ